MAEIKKDQERDELFRRIYKIATDLVHAGHVAEWDFKSYVLGTMFYRYISENFTAYINEGEHAAGNKDFDYAKMSDAGAEPAREGLVQEKGFFILPSELFCNVLARADKDDNLNETLERVFNHIESSAASGDAENDFAGLFDDFDVNSKAIGETVAKRNKVLVELLNGVAQMPLFSTDGINPDLFGDAYEYLMGMYAANAGKKGGQYFTPADVSELLARLGTIGKTKINKVYDPACGSGSLLLKVEKVLGKDNIERGFYGQEIDLTTYNLCRINMFLHNIEFDKFSIVREDTLLSPQHWDDQPFELIVSNPPFSVPWEGDKNPLLINDPRFSPAGVLAPASKGDMAFIMHSLSWLASNGAAAIVCFPGIMYRGGAEQKIRKYLVDNNFVDAIIQLPSNLFFITISNITEQNKINFSNTMFVPSSYYDALADKRKPHSGDILYTVVGSYGIPVCIEQDTKFVFQRHIAILRPRSEVIKARYMFHAMQSGAFKAQADKAAKGAAQKTIGLSSLAKMTLPVPDMCIQECLIRVLDNFDAICSDLKIGLPAEIEARQKQYEYYRDKLLSFEEKI